MTGVTQKNFEAAVLEWRDAPNNGTEILLDTGEWVRINGRTASLIWMAKLPCRVDVAHLSRIDPRTQEKIEQLRVLRVYPPAPPKQMTHPRFKLRREYIEEDDIFRLFHVHWPD